MTENKKYEKTIRLEPAFLEKIRRYLEVEPSCKSECLGEDETITETVRFENGYFMDIKCCGVQYEEGGSNLAWTEAVLFNPNGGQVAFTEPCDGFDGDWELEDNDGILYVVHVESKSV